MHRNRQQNLCTSAGTQQALSASCQSMQQGYMRPLGTAEYVYLTLPCPPTFHRSACCGLQVRIQMTYRHDSCWSVSPAHQGKLPCQEQGAKSRQSRRPSTLAESRVPSFCPRQQQLSPCPSLWHPMDGYIWPVMLCRTCLIRCEANSSSTTARWSFYTSQKLGYRLPSSPFYPLARLGWGTRNGARRRHIWLLGC